MVVQVLPFLVLCVLGRVLCRRISTLFVSGTLSLPLPSTNRTSCSLSIGSVYCSCVGALSVWHFGIENGVRLCVVQFFALLVVHAGSEEVYPLVEQVDVSE